VWALPLLGPGERTQQLEEWNATAAAYDLVTLPALVARQVARTPDALALLAGPHTVTYRQLDALASRIAHDLRTRGVTRGATVGVLMDRSVQMVAALLGILQTGAAYVPLDPDYPDARIAFMLEDVRAVVTLTQPHLRGRLPSSAATLVPDDDPASIGADADGGDRVRDFVHLDDPAYIIHTSGSTGRPKGVVVTHRGVVNCLCWMQARYGLDASDRFLFRTSLNFDPSVWEVFWPLMVGGTVVIADAGMQTDPEYLCDAINRTGVTGAYFVPSMLRLFLESGAAARCPSLRHVISGGEKLPAETMRGFLDASRAELHHSYGPTETSIAATEWTCALDGPIGVVPMGRPLGNVQVYVLDREEQPAPLGVAGELYIGGDGVALGYAGRADLTAERFVPDPFSRAGGQRLYRTGDLVRYRRDGNLEFIGRVDDQVKIRGHRIELGEIERVLEEDPAVRQAVAVVVGEGDASRLAAFVVPRDAAAAPDPAVLRGFARRRLPEAMVPAAIVAIERVPLATNGKLDRRALPPIDAPPAAYVAPRTETERRLAAMMAEVLHLDRVGVDDDFFELGGHSLLAMGLLGAIQEGFSVTIPLRAVFERSSVAQMAAVVDAARDNLYVAEPAIARAVRRALVPPQSPDSQAVSME